MLDLHLQRYRNQTTRVWEDVASRSLEGTRLSKDFFNDNHIL